MLNAVIVLFSLCLALLIGSNSVSLGLFVGLIIIDYILILLMNAEFRKATKRFFMRKGSFGSDNKHYGEIHLETMKEDIEKINPDAFEYFVADLFTELGYKTKVTRKYKDFGGDVVAKKGNDTTIIQVKHRDSSDWQVSNDAVQQAVAAMPVYKANLSMVVTNGTFTDHAYNQAKFNQTIMIDGVQLMNLVRQVVLESKEKQMTRSEDKENLSDQDTDINSKPEGTSEEQGKNSDDLGEITKADCLDEQLESVLADTIPEVTLEGTLEEPGSTSSVENDSSQNRMTEYNSPSENKSDASNS